MRVRQLSAGIGVVVVIGAAAFGAFGIFETRERAASSYAALAAYDELGRLETDRELAALEIRLLLRLQENRELGAGEMDRLAYLQDKRALIEQRMRTVRYDGR